jgi:uncharacterized protein YecE (DUF72 family)
MSDLRFYLGCAVWGYKGWVGDLFPTGTISRQFLRIYSHRLTTVEGNTTFYATPDQATVQRWLAETPERFRFCLKLSRDISHNGPLLPQIPLMSEFVERFQPLGSRLGPFFLQLPPAYSPRQISDLEGFLEAWVSNPITANYRLAVEVRHIDWWSLPNEGLLMNLLDRYGVGRVLMDVRPLNLGPLPGAEEDLAQARDRKPDVPLHVQHASDIVLLRYIGHPDLQLNGPLLDEWAEQIAAWLRAGVTVYAFMHCPQEEQSPRLCRELQQRLKALIDIPDLPWETLDEPGTYQNTMLPGF